MSPVPTYRGPLYEVSINHSLEQMGIPSSTSGHFSAYTVPSSLDATKDFPDMSELDDFLDAERPC